jgi:hypothetical protein
MQINAFLKSTTLLGLLSFFSLIAKGSDSKDNTYYAGIEVGAKGVKLCIINLAVKGPELANKIVYESSINSDFTKFSGSAHDGTIAAVLTLYRMAHQNYKVNSENIFIAISSGVKQTADREKNNESIDLLKSSIRLVIQDSDKEIDLISVYKESIYAHNSIVPAEEKMKTIVIDIGSGNTKGGYYISQNVFNVFNIPWGTKSTTSIVEKVCDTPCFSNDFINFLSLKLNQISDNDIPAAIDKCGITKYNFKILFTGGIAWATATLAKPELIKEKQTLMTAKEAEAFHKKLIFNFESIENESFNAKFKEEKNRALSVFNKNNLIGGSGLLLRIMNKFDTGDEQKQFLLAKDNKSGWLPAYIVEKIETIKVLNNKATLNQH